MSKMMERRRAARKPVEASTRTAGLVTKGRYVTLTQNENNTLSLVMSPEQIKAFVEMNSDHLPEDILFEINPDLTAGMTSERHNVWGDYTILDELLADRYGNGWTNVDAEEIGALTAAPILEAPDGNIYWHEKYQIQSSADELLKGNTVKFDGAPENKPVKGGKAASGKIAEGEVSDAPAEVTPAEVPAPTQNIPPAMYAAWSTEALAASIKALTGISEFANDKAAQQAVEAMADELKSRPVEPKEASRKKRSAYGAPAVNEESNKVLEGDDSIPSSHDHVEDETGIERPKTELPSKIAGDELETVILDEDQPTSCPRCGSRTDFENLDDVQYHTCLGCGHQFRGEFEKTASDYRSAFDQALMKLYGIDTTDAGMDDQDVAELEARGDSPEEAARFIGLKYDLDEVGDHWTFGAPKGASKASRKKKRSAFGAYAVNEDSNKVLEGDRSIPDSHDYVEDETGVDRPSTVLPRSASLSKKMGGVEYKLAAFNDGKRAYLSLTANDKNVFEVWDKTAHSLLNEGFIDGRKLITSSVEYARDMGLLKTTAAGSDAAITDRDLDIETLNTDDVRLAAAKQDHLVTMKHLGKNNEHADVPSSKERGGFNCPECSGYYVKSKAEAGKLAAVKVSAEMTTAKALKMLADGAEVLKALYLDLKPVLSVNDTRPVRNAVEAVYDAMAKFSEGQKALQKQDKQEEAELILAESQVKPKKSSLISNLITASMEEEDVVSDAAADDEE